MAAFFPVTDSLTGEPVAINADKVETIRERKSIDGEITTVIDFGRNFVQCRETMHVVENRISHCVKV